MLASIRRRTDHKPCVHASVDRNLVHGPSSRCSSSLTRFVCTPRWTTPPSCERRSQVQRRQARGSASSALLWKPSARLRVHRRASSWRSRRRSPNRSEFDVGGGTSMEASARSRRPPPSTKSGPTQDTVDSRAVDCVLVENIRVGQEARVGSPRSRPASESDANRAQRVRVGAHWRETAW